MGHGSSVSIKRVGLTIGKNEIMAGIDLDIRAGEFICLLGPSGVGKTTLLNAIAGLDKSVPEEAVMGRGKLRVGYLFQEHRLLPWRSLNANLKLVGASDPEAETLLEQVGLSGYGHYLPDQLSLGMARRAALARCLAVKPDLLLLDAPVSGGAARAASGEMTMMTSGPAEAYALAEDVLAAMAGKVYRLGDAHGAGSKVKIINQLLAGVHIAAAAEAMALGLREGVDADALYEVITHSAGNSWMFENRVPHILSGDYTPLSAVDIFVKDLGLVLDTARTSKFPLPLSAAAHQMFMMASSAGHGGEDDAAVIKIFPGIELPAKKAE